MATPSEKLAASLEILHALQANGNVAIRSADLTRTHRERLLQNGFLQEVIKGWYVPSRPDEVAGQSTAWYTAFWSFVVAYLITLKVMTGACLRKDPWLCMLRTGRYLGNCWCAQSKHAIMSRHSHIKPHF